MSPLAIDPERFPIRPQGFVGWDGTVHLGFGYGFDDVTDLTWCGALVAELPADRVPADDMPGAASCAGCLASVQLAAQLVDGVEQGSASRSELFGQALAYGAAMAAVLAAEGC